jgi:hypothetical protein
VSRLDGVRPASGRRGSTRPAGHRERRESFTASILTPTGAACLPSEPHHRSGRSLRPHRSGRRRCASRLVRCRRLRMSTADLRRRAEERNVGSWRSPGPVTTVNVACCPSGRSEADDGIVRTLKYNGIRPRGWRPMAMLPNAEVCYATSATSFDPSTTYAARRCSTNRSSWFESSADGICALCSGGLSVGSVGPFPWPGIVRVRRLGQLDHRVLVYLSVGLGLFSTR